MDFNSLPEQDRDFLNRVAAAGLAGKAPEHDAIPTVDDLLLAAWLEGQLDEIRAAPVEQELLRDPDLLDDLVSISLSMAAHPPADETILERARGLVAGSPRSTSELVPFVRPGTVGFRSLRDLLPWGAVAACLALISIVGFNLGSIVGKNEVSASNSSDFATVMNDDLD